MVGGISTECYCYLRNVQDLLADWKTPYERRFGESFIGPVFRLVQWLNIISFLRRTSQDSTHFGLKVLRCIFLGHVLFA